ncbi:MAG: hypothetical protein A3C80_04590 [Candidatus Ryanbacteria bacterium RIFCSPHIGHO2_02_FULL_45_43]|uniref:ParB-like N-terminal domain-containing protein n=1 Tax=Candidatus Ryanbacteria bacterium RIFCSPHIGHO2_01_45_13 TaxID=1802112 RepID=A0A1G2G004_9BACT|nr:MAG: hypothetical protein A2718_04490 [Candidatus Ryanbacteria bacterium RIFCSPHIGHO2_01_FULL_44_130]OGZ43664.1 MAG: hypothetical protein A2W41_04980 [Candidatus Ryanbacteria bacterium RIFCSPHIGHO2_01_45_13]OGZ49147.1 MAG: hypothetical protein A3C80_04590 [Candidatus Ryanbacteria bacterium RIFCSPHIGHO2_02_FULL_45_43]OGZ50929.1 MAG: hypothetical protein A3E55_00665 [Candidatus Ryanbacteria bacterium RIFCSPHIGHO2_12_FULL_44_20]OGZ51408.1 MAG: hypothetical protein A3A17_00290 [Candidatus Ryanba
MSDSPRQSDHIYWIETDKVKPNPMQPRHSVNEDSLKNLAASIREYGILQPLVVSRIEREVPTGTAVEYELIAGERRWRAAVMLGLREVPAVVRREESDKIKLELAIVENVQREDLNPIDRAMAYKRLMEEFGMYQREIAFRIGKSRESVANALRLLNLEDEFKEGIIAGKITEGHARPLLMLEGHKEEQKKLYENIISSNLSVREAEQFARSVALERSRKFRRAIDEEAKLAEEELGHFLGTRVLITRDRMGKGQIAIEFFSSEELGGIVKKIRTEAHNEASVDESGDAHTAQDGNTKDSAASSLADTTLTIDDLKDFTV